MTIKQELLDQIIDELKGCCDKSIQDKEEEYGVQLSHDDFVYLDGEIFNCVSCGWWCEMSEIAMADLDEPTCSNCYEAE